MDHHDDDPTVEVADADGVAPAESEARGPATAALLRRVVVVDSRVVVIVCAATLAVATAPVQILLLVGGVYVNPAQVSDHIAPGVSERRAAAPFA